MLQSADEGVHLKLGLIPWDEEVEAFSKAPALLGGREGTQLLPFSLGILK